MTFNLSGSLVVKVSELEQRSCRNFVSACSEFPNVFIGMLGGDGKCVAVTCA